MLGDTDFFIDPDTGIEPASGGNWSHIRLSDISALLPLGNKRVILIYQHAPRLNNWANALLQRLVNYEIKQPLFCKSFVAVSLVGLGVEVTDTGLPFLIDFDEHGAGQSQEGCFIREEGGDAGASVNLFVESFDEVVVRNRRR